MWTLYHTIWWDLAIMMWQIVAFKNIQLEQLECLRSEIPSTAAPWLPILVIHNFTSDPKSKQDKVKVRNFKKLPKILNFDILQETLHATHLLKLLDKMYKYEMDPTRTVGVTERTNRFHKYSVTHLTQWRQDIYLWWQVVQVNMVMLMAMVCQNYQASAQAHIGMGRVKLKYSFG